jgi:hypothetical protein
VEILLIHHVRVVLHTSLAEHVLHGQVLLELIFWSIHGVGEEYAAPAPNSLHDGGRAGGLNSVHQIPEIFIDLTCVDGCDKFVDNGKKVVEPMMAAKPVQIEDLSL